MNRRASTLSAVSWVIALAAAYVAAEIRAAESATALAFRERQAAARRVEPFALRDVRLLDGPFRHAMELNRKYLLSLDSERLLHAFRLTAGLPSSAEPLGGWEKPDSEVRGHFVGHYLSACAQMYAAAGDEALKQNADRVVAGMAQCQEKIGTGYLSAYPDEFIDRVAAGKPVWAPWYTLHKIYAGLLDMYVLTGNAQALEVLEKACGWVKSRTDQLDDAAMERMLDNEHGGMNDVLAELAAVTGKPEYLRLSQRFNHHAVLDPLAAREDRLTGLHANTQFPKILGAARQFELTGDEIGRTIATYFWDVVTGERSYVIGGNSDYERFSPKQELSKHIGPLTTETCNTHNMLKITRRIYCWEPKPAYADYYERALYNHILASQHPDTGMTCYYVPLKSGSQKTYCTPDDSFWCCTGTGVENHAKYADSIYFHAGTGELYVNLFIASELIWPEAGLKLRQETAYPQADTTRLTIACEKPLELALKLRRPGWATAGFEVAVNGQELPIVSDPSSYVEVARVWQNGDRVDVRMPMSLHTEGFRDNPRKLAVLYGPLVLSAALDRPDRQMAIVAEPAEIPAALEPVADRPATFRASSAVFRTLDAADAPPLVLAPFYQEHARPYIVYWDALGEPDWQARRDAHLAEVARTVDAVRIGDRDSEQSHALAGQRTDAGPFGDRYWRHATDGGWFSYELKTGEARPLQLRVTYWGSDAGGREFDILVDGRKIARERLDRNRPNELYDQTYDIPAELVAGKDKITVRFQAIPGKTAGGVFDLRLMKK